MVVDFSKLDLREQPVLILKNTAGKPVGTLGTAMNITADIKYNESSVLEFNLPAYTDGVKTPNYDSVRGFRIVELQGVGQFIMMNPKVSGDGIKETKACKGYSLEYEFTFKKITVESGTYNFWNPTTPESTLLGIILEHMPSWSVGTVDPSLVGKYRTFEVNGENIYNFIKSTVQQSYNCIFDFDTFNRKINVKDVSSAVPVEPVYISFDNLAKSIEVEEDTESIVTRLDVNGADGVNIRDVNPSGTNTIINLDYYMTPDNFDQEVIDKYYQWKDAYEGYQLPYYNLAVEYSMQTMRKVTESAKLTDLKGELSVLENEQAVTIQSIAQGIKEDSELLPVNEKISLKEAEISAKESEIQNLSDYLSEILQDMKAINEKADLQAYFTEDEYLLLDRYIKDDAVEESSFVLTDVGLYAGSDVGNTFSDITVSIEGTIVTNTQGFSGSQIYDARGGTISVGDTISGEVIRCALETDTNNEFLFTAYLGKGILQGTEFSNACVSITGSTSRVSSSENNIGFTVLTSYLYITHNTSEYEKSAVAWDLFDYGRELLDKVSKPSYTFSVTSANFLSLDDFVTFKNSLRHGEKLYTEIAEGQVLTPILIGAKIEWDALNNLTLEFSDKYVSGDSSFKLVDLLEQSVSMGKSVDLSKFTYSAFVDSGAQTKVKEFMTSALDVSKNAIISTQDQAISWGESGIRLRKWTDSTKTAYDPHQAWLNNNSIMMTRDNWASASLAIGRFVDPNLGDCYGVVAPNLVGTLVAGSNLVIESEKKDGSTSVFRVDGDGCVLYNSSFDIVSANNKTQIALDPQFGIVIGDYPVYTTTAVSRSTVTTKTVDEDKAKFWVDSEGNLLFRGTLKAATGEFDGKITAREGYIGNGSTGWTIGNTSIYNGKTLLSSATSGVYIGTDGISLGDGTYYFRAMKNGIVQAKGVNIAGTITAESGTIGGCEIDSSGKLHIGSANIDSISAKSITVDKITASQIEGLPTSQITSGVFLPERIPELSADKITTGELNVDLINGMPVEKITAGSNSNRLTLSNLNATGGEIGGWDIDQTGLSFSQGDFGAYISPNKAAALSISNSQYQSLFEVYNAGGCKIQCGTSNYFSVYYADSVYGMTLKTSLGSLKGTWSLDGTLNDIKIDQVTDSGGKTRALITGDKNTLNGINIGIDGKSHDLIGTWWYFNSQANNGEGASGEVAITGSDLRIKNTIRPFDSKYDTLFDNLKPVVYKYNGGQSDRLHSGFIAQEMVEALNVAGLTTHDFAAVCSRNPDDPDAYWGIRYGEIVSLNTWQIQTLKARVAELENKIALLLEEN